jgi:DNA-binding transcriptional MerR regulator
MAPAAPDLTIDELVVRTGTTSRTIREYQSLGLLEAPCKIGRVGYYDQTHVERLAVISRLQERGYSLAGIRDLIAAWSTGTELPALLGLDTAADAATADERPLVYTAGALEDVLPGISRRSANTAAQRGGLIERLDDGRYCVRSPALLQLVIDATALGVRITDALQVVSTMRVAAEAACNEIVQLFLDEVWAPHVARGRPDEADARITTFMQRSRAMLQRGAASIFVKELDNAYTRRDAPDALALRDLVTGLHVGAVTNAGDSRESQRVSVDCAGGTRPAAPSLAKDSLAGHETRMRA